MNKKKPKGTKDDIRPRRVRAGCGSLREVHLLLRGMLQTRHLVTVARIEIRDPMPSSPAVSVILVHAELVPVLVSPMAPSQSLLLWIAFANTYFNTRPPPALPSRTKPPFRDFFIYLLFKTPPPAPPSGPLLTLLLSQRNHNQHSKKALLEHGPRPLSALS